MKKCDMRHPVNTDTPLPNSVAIDVFLSKPDRYRTNDH